MISTLDRREVRSPSWRPPFHDIILDTLNRREAGGRAESASVDDMPDEERVGVGERLDREVEIDWRCAVATGCSAGRLYAGGSSLARTPLVLRSGCIRSGRCCPELSQEEMLGRGSSRTAKTVSDDVRACSQHERTEITRPTSGVAAVNVFRRTAKETYRLRSRCVAPYLVLRTRQAPVPAT